MNLEFSLIAMVRDAVCDVSFCQSLPGKESTKERKQDNMFHFDLLVIKSDHFAISISSFFLIDETSFNSNALL